MTVVLLIGTSRCGSTALQAALASFEGVAALGEVKRLSTLAARGDACGCGEPIGDCKIWGPEVAKFIPLTGSRSRFLFNAATLAASGKLLPAETRAAHSLGNMLQTIRQKNPAQVYVDSSKDPDQLLLYASLPDLDVVPVHVVRDPRGVAQSGAKRTGIDAMAMATHWHRLNAATLMLRKITPRLRWRSVRYEDFCADPLAVCRDILNAARHAAEPRGAPAPHHTLGGSPGFSLTGLDAIRTEDGWRNTMPPETQTAILRRTGWPARHFGYR